jgi:hypothetical protein
VGPISRIEVAAEPERLAVTGMSPFEARLLVSARSDVMPFRSRRRVLAQLGMGGLLSTSALASAAKAAGLKTGLSLAAAGTGVVGALAFVLSGDVPPQPAPRAPAPVVRALPLEPKPVAATRAAPARTTEPEPAPAPVPRTPRTSDALAAELRALEEARAAFVGGDPTRALRLLDVYTARFPRGSLGTEATVLRIETLAKRGDRAQAARLGRDFLASHADGPYARRVRSLAGEPTQP